MSSDVSFISHLTIANADEQQCLGQQHTRTHDVAGHAAEAAREQVRYASAEARRTRNTAPGAVAQPRCILHQLRARQTHLGGRRTCHDRTSESPGRAGVPSQQPAVAENRASAGTSSNGASCGTAITAPIAATSTIAVSVIAVAPNAPV